MRTLLALVLRALLPARGKRRASAPTQPVRRLLPADVHGAPVGRPPNDGDASTVRDVLRGEETVLVRPYFAAHERAQERRRRRERRTFLVLATSGVDYAGLGA